MIDPVTMWFELIQYSDKKLMLIVNLVETTCLVRYPWPVEITYDRGGEFLGNKLKNILIEDKYGINTKPYSSKNTQLSSIIEKIHKVLDNLVCTYNIQETYVDDTDPLMGILATSAFAVISTYHMNKEKNPF